MLRVFHEMCFQVARFIEHLVCISTHFDYCYLANILLTVLCNENVRLLLTHSVRICTVITSAAEYQLTNLYGILTIYLSASYGFGRKIRDMKKNKSGINLLVVSAPKVFYCVQEGFKKGERLCEQTVVWSYYLYIRLLRFWSQN